MNIIILLAGYGTRLRPHTYTKPKPLITVAGKPVLGHILDGIANVQIDKVAFVVGYLGDQFEPYVKRVYPGLNAEYIEQKEANGQASAVLLAKDAVSGPTVVIFGDTVTDADLSKLASAEGDGDTADGVLYVREVEDPRRFGVVQVGEQGFIQRVIEKPSTMENRLALIGAYYVKDAAKLMAACQELIDRDIKTKGEYYFADALNLMIDHGAKFKTERAEVWLDCGKPDAVLETNRYLLSHGQDNSAHWANGNCVIVPPVNIPPSAKIESSVIGPNASIGENCQIINSVIRESIVDSGAYVSDHVLANSLIGRDAVLMGRPRKFNVGDSSVVGFDED